MAQVKFHKFVAALPVTLEADSIYYVRVGAGFDIYVTNSGGTIVAYALNSGVVLQAGYQRAKLGADVINANAVANTLADVTGLSFPVVAGNTYKFRFFIIYTAAATTTGSRWTINAPAVTTLNYRSEYSLTATSITSNEGLSAVNTAATANASSAATVSNIAIIEGVIVPSANGVVIARFASEIAASAIVAKAGRSFVEWEQI